jgi:hypothetical protein
MKPIKSLTREEAMELLSYHTGRNSDIDNPKWEKGFLMMLRPYRGHLIEDNYHEVIACIAAVADDLRNPEYVPTLLINDLWNMCHLAKVWGVSEGGMLRSNKLISDEDVERLELWIDVITETVLGLLEGYDDEQAFHIYYNP